MCLQSVQAEVKIRQTCSTKKEKKENKENKENEENEEKIQKEEMKVMKVSSREVRGNEHKEKEGLLLTSSSST